MHCETTDIDKTDIIVDITLPSGIAAKVGINVRPHFYETLLEISKSYILIIYTASHKSYADAVLDYLDPSSKLFKYRLYRDNCIKVAMDDEFVYVKDLRILKNINMKNTVIIDNSVLSFAFQLENGIPVLPFYDNKEDEEFKFLINYLNHLSKVDDIREENKNNFKLEYLKKIASPKKNFIDVDIDEDHDIPLIGLSKKGEENTENNSNSNDLSSFSSSDQSFSNSILKDQVFHMLDDLRKSFAKEAKN